jgi:PEP-CTERM motif
MKKVFQALWIPSIILLLAAHARAGTVISYTTDDAGTEYVGGINSLILNSTAGVAATLTFSPNTASATGVPSNINFGSFLLYCSDCTTVQSTIFSAFTFDLVVTDTSDNAAGEFVGTSSGGMVSSNSSTVEVDWQAPYTIGPGPLNALTGNFGSTAFDIISPTTLIGAPNSGSVPGNSTVSGQLISPAPEPATLVLIGGALCGVGLVGRKKAPRR